MLSDMLALEGATVNVRSNAVCPGDVSPGVQATPSGFTEHAEDPTNWTLPPAGRSARRATWPHWSRGSRRRTRPT